MDKSLAVVKVKVISISKKSLPLVEAQLLRRATKPPLPWQQAPLASFTNQQEARGEQQEIKSRVLPMAYTPPAKASNEGTKI